MRRLNLAALLFIGAFGSALAQSVSVGPQYDTTHVYVAPDDFDRFVKSFASTFDGKTSPQGVFQVTPTPSQTMSQLILTPVGTVSVFGFKTPVPYPFGAERTGYLVTDMDGAIRSAKDHGADILVAPFNDPIGRDAVIQWAGGINMQIYWHTTKPNFATLKTIPENRLYLSPERAGPSSMILLPSPRARCCPTTSAPGIEIGRPNETYRRIRIDRASARSWCTSPMAIYPTPMDERRGTRSPTWRPPCTRPSKRAPPCWSIPIGSVIAMSRLSNFRVATSPRSMRPLSNDPFATIRLRDRRRSRLDVR